MWRQMLTTFRKFPNFIYEGKLFFIILGSKYNEFNAGSAVSITCVLFKDCDLFETS